MVDYQEFLNQKSQMYGDYGFDPVWMPDFLFDFQKYLVEWSLKKGRSAIFADCGMGKTPMQLVWAENVARRTNGKILIVTPLSVSRQTIQEGEKFGIEVARSRDGQPKGHITITNYEQLSKFNPDDFVATVCDESSILKNFTGKTKFAVTRFMQKQKYRLLCTATAAPNDYVEFGTSSEALGQLPYMDMLQQFFRDTSNDKNPQWSKPKWELKGHAIDVFWQWIAGWARACRMPSDLGFADGGFKLPELTESAIILKCSKPNPGELFINAARTLGDQREERKATIEERCSTVEERVRLHDRSVIWCHYNYEGETLAKVIPGAVEISGKDNDDAKEDKFNAFSAGEIDRLVIKPKIGAFGLNWQHCNHVVYFPSHSYEQYYQAIRRCWRFGQRRPVTVDIIDSEKNEMVYLNMKRKSHDAIAMFDYILDKMGQEVNIDYSSMNTEKITVPGWLRGD